MNTMLKLFLIAVMAMGFTAEASASDRSTQLMRERNVPPSVLAARVEACLNEDATGMHCRPEGSNATPAQYMAAINANPEGKVLVRNVGDLPKFLRGLKSGPFTGEQCLAGMNGTELAAYCRNLRAPHAGEVAWWHGDTFVLAGDCLNARVGYKATLLGTVQVTGTTWQGPATSRRFVPFEGVDRGQQCSDAKVRLTGIHVYAQEAYNTDCAQRFVHNPGNYTAGRGTIGSYVSNGREDVFSLQCGAGLHQAQMAGQIQFSTTQRPVELLLVRDGNAKAIFTGTVRGNILAGATENDELLLTEDKLFVDVPDQFREGFLVWNFPGGGMISPTESGAGMDIRRLETSQGCHRKVKVASAIEGQMAAPVATTQGQYSYGQ